MTMIITVIVIMVNMNQTEIVMRVVAVLQTVITKNHEAVIGAVIVDM